MTRAEATGGAAPPARSDFPGIGSRISVELAYSPLPECVTLMFAYPAVVMALAMRVAHPLGRHRS